MLYKTFTNNLKMYKENKKEVERIKEELDVILYDLSNVKGIGYDQQGGSTNLSQKALNWLKMDEKYNAKLNELEYYESAIKSVDLVKARLPKKLWLMLYDKFVKDMTYREVGLKYGYSDHGVWAMMKRETERFL